MSRHLVLTIALLGASAAALPSFIKPSPRLVWNASASVPIGLYAVSPVDKLQTGELVVVNPPDGVAGFLNARAYLPRGVLLLKHILALGSQTVCRVGSTLTVDSIAVGDARERDGRGRALPVWSGCRVLADGDVFLMNVASPDSLDGRYFGPLPAASIVGRAEPLWTAREK